ncbi:hypothetical protein PQR53_38625 [Paraburkholderia fungorum]|uniref:hypothetical protein n=1 Tax=Paraburkholderia fungorum TaxID=134537 RepID=UPI0038B90ED1
MSASTSLRRSFGSASAMADTFLNAPELAKLTIELFFLSHGMLAVGNTLPIELFIGFAKRQ